MNVRQAKFVKAKLEGKSNTQAALEAVPTLKPSSAPNIGMRLSKQVDIQDALSNALQKHQITIDRTAQVVSEALDATKQNQYTGEIVVDHTVRLKAADMAHGLMGLKGQRQEQPPQPINDPKAAKQLAAALEASDEIKLSQIVFNRKDDS